MYRKLCKFYWFPNQIVLLWCCCFKCCCCCCCWCYCCCNFKLINYSRPWDNLLETILHIKWTLKKLIVDPVQYFSCILMFLLFTLKKWHSSENGERVKKTVTEPSIKKLMLHFSLKRKFVHQASFTFTYDSDFKFKMGSDGNKKMESFLKKTFRCLFKVLNAINLTVLGVDIRA